MGLAASTLDAAGCEDERVIGIRGLVDYLGGEIFGGGCERGERGGRSGRGCGGRISPDEGDFVGGLG